MRLRWAFNSIKDYRQVGVTLFTTAYRALSIPSRIIHGMYCQRLYEIRRLSIPSRIILPLLNRDVGGDGGEMIGGGLLIPLLNRDVGDIDQAFNSIKNYLAPNW